jgi:hypothetical protein
MALGDFSQSALQRKWLLQRKKGIRTREVPVSSSSKMSLRQWRMREVRRTRFEERPTSPSSKSLLGEFLSSNW